MTLCCTNGLRPVLGLLTNKLFGLETFVINDDPEEMSPTRDRLDTVPLIAFLEAYSEPAFILCCNSAPHESLDFIYGNPALHSLIFGEDDSGTLDKDSFFSALASDEDALWLSNPVRPQTLPPSAGDFHLVGFRPSWLPRDHMPLNLELTPTSITLPVTMSGVRSSSRSYVFTASPRKAAMDLLRSDPGSDFSRRRDSGLRLHDLPQLHLAVGQRVRSRNSKSETSSWLSQRALMNKPTEMPSTLIEKFPWEETPLGPRALWPTSLKTILSYLMEKPIPVSFNSLDILFEPYAQFYRALYFGDGPSKLSDLRAEYLLIDCSLTTIYNDAYAKMIRGKHPVAFGKSASKAVRILTSACLRLTDVKPSGPNCGKCWAQ